MRCCVLLSYFLTVGGQIFMMFLMVLVGYLMYKRHMLTENGIKEMSVLLLKIVTPMILVSAFQREFEAGLFKDWVTMFLASALTYGVSIVLSIILYRRESRAEERMCIFLPNNGFLAFPLMQALAGEFGIFLGSTSVILLNVIQWTYGVKLLKPDAKINIKNIILNPGVIGIVLGLLLFFSPWKLPKYVFSAVDAIGSLNTPLAMIVLGGMLAQTDLKKELKTASFYKISVIKLIVLPFIMLGLFYVLPLSDSVKLVAFICSVTPAATSVSMLSQIFDGDYRYAASAVVITTVLSALTMPIILTIGKAVLGY